MGKLETVGRVANRRGTKVRFRPDPQIFKEVCKFSPARLFKMARAKAYLFGGVEIRWKCAPELLDRRNGETPPEAVFHFPGGLKDYLAADIEGKTQVSRIRFSSGEIDKAEATARSNGRWPGSPMTTVLSIPTATPFRRPMAAPTRAGLALALLRALKDHAERIGQGKRAAADHRRRSDGRLRPRMLSVFIREPEFQGQTKDRLTSRGGLAHRRERGARRFRPLARRLSRTRRTSFWTG